MKKIKKIYFILSILIVITLLINVLKIESNVKVVKGIKNNFLNKEIHTVPTNREIVEGLDPKVKEKLLEFFKSENSKLGELKEKNFSIKLEKLYKKNEAEKDLYKDELDLITEISIYDKSIFENLSNIRLFKNLKELDATLYLISEQDKEIISTLTNLRKLSLLQNNLTDISFIKKLGNLEFLNLEDNDISDITPVTNLKNIKKLLLNNNNIVNIPDLSMLTGLITLDLRNNLITDITSLRNLNMPEDSEILLPKNRIKDFSSLKNKKYDIAVQEDYHVEEPNQKITINSEVNEFELGIFGINGEKFELNMEDSKINSVLGKMENGKYYLKNFDPNSKVNNGYIAYTKIIGKNNSGLSNYDLEYEFEITINVIKRDQILNKEDINSETKEMVNKEKDEVLFKEEKINLPKTLPYAGSDFKNTLVVLLTITLIYSIRVLKINKKENVLKNITNKTFRKNK